MIRGFLGCARRSGSRYIEDGICEELTRERVMATARICNRLGGVLKPRFRDYVSKCYGAFVGLLPFRYHIATYFSTLGLLWGDTIEFR